MSKLTSFPGGLLLGAGLMYFLDPLRGPGRRRRINEAVMHAERVERAMLQKAVRDAKQRAHGLAERITHPPATDVSDEVIEQRLRARIGRAVSHPRALEIIVHAGHVILRGPVLEHEAPALLRMARIVPGVIDVIDRLERHATAESVPALQGKGRRRRTKGTWPPAAQAGATGAGALMAAYGFLLKRGLVGAVLGTAGGALAVRATVNKPLRSASIRVTKNIIVRQPIHVVFDLWSRLDNFPLFMQHVQEVDVQVGGNRSRWIVDGPAGTRLVFEAETILFEPDRAIGWRTLPGQRIEHEGRVRFESVAGGTRVTVDMTYRPPGGVFGHALAHLLGWDPKTRMDEDLVRMKALLEAGRTRAHHHHVELADLH
jgi:uncharacterized membrane protein